MAGKVVDKIFEIMKDPNQIRNIATCAHIDHGKTTFSDNLLSGAGMMSKEDAGSALKLDFHDDEQERGITIDTAAVSMVHATGGKEYLINLLDTPGHVDFGGDVTRAMRAVDGAIVLCCAVEGIMPQTETVLRQALKERVKPVLYINKVDRLIKEVKLTPEDMQKKFIEIINSVNKLIVEIAEPEYGEKWQVNVQDGSVGFGSAYHNWGLSIPYMQKKGITFKDVIEAYTEPDENKLKENIKALAEKAPLHEVVLDMVIEHHPGPSDAQKYRIPKIWHGELESEEGKSLMACNPNGPLFFVVTKIVVDPQAGEIAAGRLFSGTMEKGKEVYLSMNKSRGRVQQVFVYNGAKREIVDNVPCGNIIGISGAKTFVGETVTLEEAEPFEKISHIFDPVITKAIEATTPADLPKLIEILRIVAKEDPTIQIEINEETGENLMHGMGELHLEVIENRIRDEKGLKVKTSNPIVVYRETIGSKSPEIEGKTPNKHNKFYFYVEPLEPAISEAIKKGELPEIRLKKKDLTIRDKLVECGMDSKVAIKVKEFFQGNMFLDQTRGLVHIGEIMEMVLDMFEDVIKSGPLAKEPCIGVKVVFTDAKLHEDAIHRGPAQVYPAVRDAMRESIATAGPCLFEPIQTLLIEGPLANMGDLTKLIQSKRGQVADIEQGAGHVEIKTKLPVAEMIGMASDLRSATEGRGTFSMVDQTFEKVPSNLQPDIVKRIRDRKGLADNE